MRKIRILWTDDEVEAMKPHIIFLEEKGYVVDTCFNGNDTVDLVRNSHYDIVFLDENMPGLSGIETLKYIREACPSVPVVMVTKSDEEDIMEAAIGSEIADYLIKPVKPKQILLVIKRLIDQQRLVTEKTTIDFQQEFNRIGKMIAEASSFADWTDIYRKIIYWETELEKSTDQNMPAILMMQEDEANNQFAKYISKNYLKWFEPGNNVSPVLSNQLLAKKVFPLLSGGRPLFFILIDNLRFDQWKTISAELRSYYRVVSEDIFCSILPTVTQFSRNAIFSGLMPLAIKERLPDMWVDEFDDEGKNIYEEQLFANHLVRRAMKIKWSYNKISTAMEGKKVNETIDRLLKNDFNIMVFNFVDMLSHARTDNKIIRDLADKEPAYRSLTKSWFVHSSLFEMLKKISVFNVRVVFATDHGTIRVQNPIKIVGDKQTTANLRYKTGKNIVYNASDVFEIKNPEKACLPKSNISSKYIFAKNKDYLIYHKNYNQYANYYKNTFQHGGISMQEMLLPVAVLEPIR